MTPESQIALITMLGTLLGAIVAAIGAGVLAWINLRSKVEELKIKLAEEEKQKRELKAERDLLRATAEAKKT